MPKYTAESIERVKDAIDMVDLVGSRTELKRAGVSRLQGLCPFHDERTPSFGIDPVQKVYHCFGCGVGGDGIRFVQEVEGVGFLDAIELLSDRYGVELELAEEDPQEAERRQRQARLYELLERTCSFYERILWESKEAEAAREYLLGRGLTEESLRRFRVGYAPSAWDTVLLASQRAGYRPQEIHAAGLAKRGKDGGRIFDMFRRRITFPLADTRGRVIGFGARAMGADQKPKYVNTPESELFHKRKLIYAADLARSAAAKAGTVLVAEGYTDVVALHQAGFENTVAIMGTSLTDEQVVALKRLAPVAHLALDADNAGQEAMLRASAVAEREHLEMRVVPLPVGRDPAELVAEEGREAVERLLERSLPFVRFRVQRALGKADTSSAEGKDRLLEELKPEFSQLGPSIQRSELVRMISDRIDVPDADVDRLLRQPQRRPSAPSPREARRSAPPSAPAPAPAPSRASARPAPAPVPAYAGDDRAPFEDPGPEGSDDDGRWGPAPSAQVRRGGGGGGGGGSRGPDLTEILRRTEQVERRFLAFCLALPDLGSDALARLDPAEHFTSDLTRRAAEHLRGHLRTPREALPPDDPELDALITELVVRSAAEPASPATLEAQRLQLELRRLDHRMRTAREAKAGGYTELARARAQVKAEFDLAMERANATD